MENTITHCPLCDIQLIHKEHHDICPSCGWSNEPEEEEKEEE